MLNGLELENVAGHDIEVGGTCRLSDALFYRERTGFSSFVALPSNLRAVESAMLFAGGLTPFVAIVGASGWGKTHALHAAALMIKSETGTHCAVSSAIDWLAHSTRADAHTQLILDDVQAVLTSQRARQQLRLILERRVRGGKPTLLAFTVDHNVKAVRTFLPCQREWTVSQITEPQLNERELFVRNLADRDRLHLNAPLIRLIAHQVQGNGRSIAGALQRLKLVQNRWTDSESVLQAIGLLDPYIAGCRGLDLRDCTHEAILRCWPVGSLDGATTATELSVYVMLRLLEINEKDVARYFRLDERDVYMIANRVAAMRKDGRLREIPDRCAQAIIASLERV